VELQRDKRYSEAVIFGGFGNNVVDHGEPTRFRDVTSLPAFDLDQVPGRSYGRAHLEPVLPPPRFPRLGAVPFHHDVPSSFEVPAAA